MADPIIYEDAVLGGLQSDVCAATGDVLRSSILLSVVNAFDRKILRDPFIEITSNAVAFSNNVGRIEILEQVARIMAKGKLTPTTIEEAIAQVRQKAYEQQKNLCRSVALVMQCPVSEDKVH